MFPFVEVHSVFSSREAFDIDRDDNAFTALNVDSLPDGFALIVNDVAFGL